MRKLLFLCLILLTWYLAAMYHLPSLMVLAVAEILLFAVMFGISRSCKRKIRAGFDRSVMAAYKNQKTECTLFTENRGRLPGGRLRLRFRAAYWSEKDRKCGRLYVDPGGPGSFFLSAPCRDLF